MTTIKIIRRRRSLAWRWLGLLLVGLLLILGWGIYSRAALQPLMAPLPQDPQVQVYMNQSQAAVYTDPYRQIRRHGDDLETIILGEINQAQRSIDVAVQELNLPKIARALSDRAQAGIAVRVILENQYNQVWQDRGGRSSRGEDERARERWEEQRRLIDRNGDGAISREELAVGDAVRVLQAGGVPLIDDTADGSRGSGLMHHKFMVVDSQRVVMGSVNWTLSDIHGDFANSETRGNANALLVIHSPQIASIYGEEFALMWGDGPGGEPDSRFGLQKPPRSPRNVTLGTTNLTVQFSPSSPTRSWNRSTNGVISTALSQAQRTIDLALFVFSDQTLGDRLFALAQAGVTIRALIDPGFAYRYYSTGLDMLGQAIPDHRCQMQPNNRPWPRPIQAVGIPNLADGDKLHHKFALIDNTTVIVGSHNWSAAANHNNDENTLIIQNPTVAAHFRREFDRLLTGASLGVSQELQNRLTRQRRACNLQ